MIGRLSAEKRQDVLIDAIDRCAHRDQIQLVLAGQGPKREALLGRAKSCPILPLSASSRRPSCSTFLR